MLCPHSAAVDVAAAYWLFFVNCDIALETLKPPKGRKVRQWNFIPFVGKSENSLSMNRTCVLAFVFLFLKLCLF